METQTQTQDQIQKRRSKLESLREKVKQAESEVATHAEVAAERLRTARLIEYNLHASIAAQEGNSEGEVADPTEEELEAIEPISVPKAVSYYETRYDRLKKQVKEEEQKRKISNETPEDAYEEYIKAQEELSTFTALFISLPVTGVRFSRSIIMRLIEQTRSNLSAECCWSNGATLRKICANARPSKMPCEST